MSGVERLKACRALDSAAQDLGSWTSLEAPLKSSLDWVRTRPGPETALESGGLSLTWSALRESLELLLSLLPRLDRRPELLARHFLWFKLAPAPVMTAYCTPEIEASLTRRPGYEHPLYGVPWAASTALLSCLDRRAVDIEGVLAGRGLEIAWAKDPVDLFYLHVEGCGRLSLPDGGGVNVLFGATNGRGFKSLGEILAEKGCLPPHALSKRHVRGFFERHPDKMFGLMSENRRYVFFRLSDSDPEGAMGKALTPLVSLATDPGLVPLGSVLVFSNPARVSEGRGRVLGIGLAQDAGAAIKGPRLDWYYGTGRAAEDAAQGLKAETPAYLLVAKEALNR
ncbi:MAG: MltA domain-containing protein [Desulfovibrionaceae bacterium]|nr:MltA domain-containing protein [Desulfovibrionaceae bacterium]